MEEKTVNTDFISLNLLIYLTSGSMKLINSEYILRIWILRIQLKLINFFNLPLGIRIAEYFHSQEQQFPLAGFYNIKKIMII